MKLHRYLTTTLLVLTLCGLAQACPTCKESVAENGGNLVRGYFWSICFMMSMPFLIFGTLCSLFYWQVRSASRRQAHALAETQSVPTVTA